MQTTASVPNGVFDSSGYTLYGVTYAGQTRACALTNIAGVLLPLAQCAIDVRRTFRRPHLDTGAGPRPSGPYADLCDCALRVPGRRDQ